MAHPAAVLARRDVQPQMESVLDAPMRAVSLSHLEGREALGGARSDQPVGIDHVGLGPGRSLAQVWRAAWATAGKADQFGRGRKGDQAAGFEPAAIEFKPLNEVCRGRRGEKAPTSLGSSWRTLSATPGWLPLTVSR